MPWGRGRAWPGRGFWGWPGNPYPFCRWFPWLPRWWWAYPYWSYYAAYPTWWGYRGFPWLPGWGLSPYSAAAPYY
ncbi:hypothetical protein J7L60_00715 [Candidatus Bathyarchaeota archaeon]|nr:hypothetical protein [Candidatus Bathyarchaeota archaeon]MCD6262924.1 hypothetical protein [Candidatus Bathyarchaeota archaeon]